MNKKSKKNSVTLAVYPLMFTQLEKWVMQRKSKKCKKMLDGWLVTVYKRGVAASVARNKKGETMAPSQREKGKRSICFYIPVELYQAFKKRAAELNSNMAELLTLYIIKETKNIQLTREDYEEILEYENRKR